MTGEHEEVLAGGNMTAVVRVGDAVRRGAEAVTPDGCRPVARRLG